MLSLGFPEKEKCFGLRLENGGELSMKREFRSPDVRLISAGPKQTMDLHRVLDSCPADGFPYLRGLHRAEMDGG